MLLHCRSLPVRGVGFVSAHFAVMVGTELPQYADLKREATGN